MPDFDSIFPETAALLRRPKRVLMLDELFALQRPVYSSVEEIDEHVRSMRDERE
jgi:hypothetical protein